MLDMNIRKTINKLTLKRKTAKARVNAKKVITRFCHVCVKLSTKILRCRTIPTFNMIKVNRYDNRGKVCESKKLFILECSLTLKNDQNLACIALFKKCAEYFKRHFQYGFRYAALLKIVYASNMKSLGNMPESLETVNSDLFAIFLENNSSMTYHNSP